LVTGGTGYIGSHCIVELLESGYDVVVVDNLVNSHSGALVRVKKLTGKSPVFYKIDLLDASAVDAVFKKHRIHYVIHFAAIKAVGESMQFPLNYYKNNVIGTINLIEAMKTHGVSQLVFSSSCTVYGDPEHLPITEDHPTGNVTNVYGRTKYFIEEMLKDLSRADPDKWNIISLRYFNPVGAHPSGMMGEDPTKPFTNLMPFISSVAIGNRDKLTVFGTDYDTVDGTGVRDYIHVVDLAKGHVAALAKLDKEQLKHKDYNLGLGHGLSVLELLREFEAVCGVRVPWEAQGRRVGDVATLVCDPSLGQQELQWRATRGVKVMCEDFWRWQQQNPRGYPPEEVYEATPLSTSSQTPPTKACTNGTGAAQETVHVNGLH